MRIGRFQSKRGLLVAGAIVLALSSVAVASAADPASGQERADGSEATSRAERCARQFEESQRIDMESFRDYDAEAFREVHHPDAVTVFASGTTRYGIDAIMEALAPHFAGREAVWAWAELYRVVDRCKSAFILYDTTYDIESIGFHQHALTGVTYTHRGHRWLAIADQGTLLEE